LCLNAAVIGYFLKELSLLERIIVGACAIALFFPSVETDVIGCVVVMAFLVKKWVQKRRSIRKQAPAA
jgi:TRAP-type uncharacterized transport system fused permease subunit